MEVLARFHKSRSAQRVGLHINVYEAAPSICSFEVAGDVDADTRDVFDNALGSMIDEGWTRIILDATKLSFMNSDGIGAVIAHLKQVRERGGDIKFLNLHGKGATVVEVLGLKKFLQLYESMDKAISAFEKPVPEELYKEVQWLFFASNRGKFYHTEWCARGKRIKYRNRIRFASKEDARKSGKKPCPKCGRGGR